MRVSCDVVGAVPLARSKQFHLWGYAGSLDKDKDTFFFRGCKLGALVRHPRPHPPRTRTLRCSECGLAARARRPPPAARRPLAPTVPPRPPLPPCVPSLHCRFRARGGGFRPLCGKEVQCACAAGGVVAQLVAGVAGPRRRNLNQLWAPYIGQAKAYGAAA